MKKENVRIFWALVNTAGFLLVLTVNALANILPLNGKMTGELSDSYPNLFVPAGLTFSIWGVIYLLLAAFSVFQIVRVLGKGKDTEFMDRLGPFYFLSSLANSLWIFAWHWERIFLSLCLMLLLLFTLLTVYIRLKIGRSEAGRPEKLFVHLPVSVYLGWITVATIANVTALLVSLGWTGLGPGEVFWTILVIAVGVLITLMMIFRRKDTGYALVVLWAYLGIYIKRQGVGDPAALAVEIAALAGMILIGLAVIAGLAGGRRWKKSR